MEEPIIFEQNISVIFSDNYKLLGYNNYDMSNFVQNPAKSVIGDRIRDIYDKMEKNSHMNSNDVYKQSKIKKDKNVEKSINKASELVKITTSRVNDMKCHLPNKEKMLSSKNIPYNDHEWVSLDENHDVNNFACSLANSILEKYEYSRPNYPYYLKWPSDHVFLPAVHVNVEWQIYAHPSVNGNFTIITNFARNDEFFAIQENMAFKNHLSIIEKDIINELSYHSNRNINISTFEKNMMSNFPSYPVYEKSFSIPKWIDSSSMRNYLSLSEIRDKINDASYIDRLKETICELNQNLSEYKYYFNIDFIAIDTGKIKVIVNVHKK